jgi:ribosomal protein S11
MMQSKLYRNQFAYFKRLYEYNFTKKVLTSLAKKNDFYQKMVITISQNNMFCTFSDLKSKKTIHTGSSGIYKLKISKRKLKHYYMDFLTTFFRKIRRSYGTLQNTLINLTAPIRLRRKIVKFIKTQVAESGDKEKMRDIPYNVLINIAAKKCFNGCTPRKKLRKKRLLYTIYK